ncbi:MAG: hypothetical protein KGJ98_06285 [Chloroflexota bacterium]|nr:hypothetical protein [Chloroflexota bacterium]
MPCRRVGCDEVFQVGDQNSMEALRAASAARDEHETATHDYHHMKLATERGYRPLPRTRTPRSSERGG